MSRFDLVQQLFRRYGPTLARLKFLPRLLNVLGKLFPPALDNTTMQDLYEDFLIFQR